MAETAALKDYTRTGICKDALEKEYKDLLRKNPSFRDQLEILPAEEVLEWLQGCNLLWHTNLLEVS